LTIGRFPFVREETGNQSGILFFYSQSKLSDRFNPFLDKNNPQMYDDVVEEYGPRGYRLMGGSKISIPKDRIAEFCKRNRVRKLSLFGSVLRKDFGPDSDVDILVEFEPGARIGLIRLSGLEIELGNIVGRKVDLNTPGFLSKYYCDQILVEADVQYDAT
jgi:hypothetical protein